MSTLRRKRPDGRPVAVSDDMVIYVAPHSGDLAMKDREAGVVLLRLLKHTWNLERHLRDGHSSLS